MKKIKEFWSKLKYWQKGGIIGGFVTFLYSFFVLLLFSPSFDAGELTGWHDVGFTILTAPASVIYNEYLYYDFYGLFPYIGNIYGVLIVLFFLIVEGTLIGVLIGLIIGKLKKK